MGIEIERKFLVIQDHWKLHIEKSLSTTMRQGYLSSLPERVVRVRIEKNAQGELAMLTIKGKASGISRGEWSTHYFIECLKSPLCGLPPG